MPLYEFRNKNTGEVFEKMMSISAKAEYLEQNPNIESYISGAPPLMDPVTVGVRRTDQGFKEVLQRIHEKTPGSQLNKTTRQL